MFTRVDGSFLICKTCTKRKKDVVKNMKRTGAIKCTCTKSGNMESHIPSNEGCKLYPRLHGQKRWPGMNRDVTYDDFEFFQRLAKKRKQ